MYNSEDSLQVGFVFLGRFDGLDLFDRDMEYG